MDRIRVKKPHKILQISIVHNNKKPLELTEMKVWMVYSVSRVHKPLLLRLPKIATFPVCIFFPPFILILVEFRFPVTAQLGLTIKYFSALLSCYPEIMRQLDYYEPTTLAKPICRN